MYPEHGQQHQPEGRREPTLQQSNSAQGTRTGMAMGRMSAIAIHQRTPTEQGREGLVGEGFTAIAIDPIVQCSDIDIGGSRQETSLGKSCTTAPLGQGPFLPVQKHLVVFQDGVVSDVLKPCRSQAQHQAGNR